MTANDIGYIATVLFSVAGIGLGIVCPLAVRAAGRWSWDEGTMLAAAIAAQMALVIPWVVYVVTPWFYS